MALRVRTHLLLALVLGLLAPSAAHAENASSEAARHYDEGAKALQRGDLRAAAHEFADADRIAPHPTTLTEALRAALDVGDAELVHELVIRAEGRARNAELDRLLEQARRIDAKPAPTPAPAPAPRMLQLEAPAGCQLRDSSAVSGLRLVTVACPQASSSVMVSATEAYRIHADYKTRRGPPPFVALATGGLSLAALTFGIVRGVAAGGLHDDLVDADCKNQGSGACRDLAARGESAQTQANVGFVAAGVLGAAAVGLFLWQRSASVSLSVSPQRSALALSVRWP